MLSVDIGVGEEYLVSFFFLIRFVSDLDLLYLNTITITITPLLVCLERCSQHDTPPAVFPSRYGDLYQKDVCGNVPRLTG